MRLLKQIVLSSLALASWATAATADPHIERGAQVFAECANCHTLNEGGRTIYGPNLYGVIGRRVASLPDFPYSPAMKAVGGVWTLKKLNAFLAKPQMAVQGTHMTYKGVMSPHDREDLLAWLEAVQTDQAPEPSASLIAQVLAKGDAEHGKRLFRPCTVCHSFTPGAANKIGPNLSGVVGRPVASAPGFMYSARLKGRGGFWTPELLNAFIAEKKDFAQGSHLAFKKLQKPSDRADIIAYLIELSPEYRRQHADNRGSAIDTRP